MLLKARNPFTSRRLPHIIGSEEFSKHDHLGLATSSEEEDDDKESDAEEETGEDDETKYTGKRGSKIETVDHDTSQSKTRVNDRRIRRLRVLFVIVVFIFYRFR